MSSGAILVSFWDDITQAWVTVSATNPFPVQANVVANVGATATAANPAYAEGASEPLSLTLFGAMRTMLLAPDGTPYTAGGGLTAVATAANPVYSEGDDEPLSLTLDGFLRTNARQSGAWIVGQDGPWSVDAVQSGPWSVDAVQSGPWNVGGLGTPGAPAGGVVTVQGDAAGDPIPVSECAGVEACAASATTTLGGAGAIGDELFFVEVYPATTSPGAVTIRDGSNVVATFPGGASSVTNLVPFILAIYAKSAAGAWSVQCGANVTATGSGRFT